MRFLDAIRRDHRVTDFHYRVGAEIMSFCNLKSGLAWPSHQTMANNLGASVSGVMKAVTALVDLGYFQLERGRGRGHSNRYFPNINADGQAPFQPEKVDSQERKGGRPGVKNVPGGPHELNDERSEELLPPSKSPASASGDAPPTCLPEIASQWPAVIAAAGRTLDPEAVTTWLKPLAPGELDGDALVIHAPGRAFADRVRGQYGGLLSGACRAHLGVEQIEFRAP